MNFTTNWNASKKPRKQHNYVKNAPPHIRGRFLGSHLSKELRAKYKTRTLRVRRGDKVKIMRGQHRGKIGIVDRVDTKKTRIYITGADYPRKDGTKALYPIHPSNVLIQELHNDKRRTGEKT